jgi:hypothetical protein
VLAGLPAGASLVRECDLLTLERAAGAVILGRCLERTEVPDGRPLPYTEYTFEVLSAVKGARDAAGRPLATVTFRHAGCERPRELPDGTIAAPLRLNIPRYEVEREYLLFLTRESALGLCAPVGLGQGSFTVERRGKKKFVRNANANAGLLEKIDASSFAGVPDGEIDALRRQASSLDLERFLELVRSIRE